MATKGEVMAGEGAHVIATVQFAGSGPSFGIEMAIREMDTTALGWTGGSDYIIETIVVRQDDTGHFETRVKAAHRGGAFLTREDLADAIVDAVEEATDYVEVNLHEKTRAERRLDRMPDTQRPLP